MSRSCSLFPCFRDMVLLKCGTWSKKIEVVKASKGEEISVNVISSEYGRIENPPYYESFINRYTPPTHSANSCLTVGLDIHQKFNVYYSGARRFGADNPNSIAHDPPAPSPPSRRQALSQQEITTFVNKQGTNTAGSLFKSYII